MFSSSLYGMRMGRLAFGITLLVGTAAMYLAAIEDHYADGLHAGEIVLVTWAAAFALGAAVRAACGRSTRSAAGLQRSSVVIPAVGVALLLPLTLLMFGLQLAGDRIHEFDMWVQVAPLFVGVPHIVFAAMLGTRAARLVTGRAAPSPWMIYGWSVVASAFPGVLLYFIPSILVAVVGLPILPLMFWMQPYLERERAREETELPRAVVVQA
jgi:hypothetical protein